MNNYFVENNILKCNFSGKLDSFVAQNIENELVQNYNESINKVIFNLESVDFVSSSFLRSCIKYSQKVGKNNLILTNPNPTVMRVLEIANLKELCTIE